MRLPPSSTAWRMPPASRGSGTEGKARAASSAASIRLRQASSSGPDRSGPPGSDIVVQARERFALLRLLRIAEQLHTQFRLLQCLLAAAVQADAALVGGQRLLKAQFATLHVVDQGFKLFERLLEVGDGGRVG